ncbi:uncharacterized protein [Eurosta solidaginis]|uniref:uncharacterized protein n=1 Tax=Eurosta solidaginis TaxID=178769 RepID=UPI00353142CB
MTCRCGTKVERAQAKVQCSNCNKLFHLHCVGMQQTDLEYLLSSNTQFLCDECKAVRRCSLRSPLKNNTASNERQCNQNIDNQSLALLIDELAEVKALNSNILCVVNAVREDNECLRNKVETLQTEIIELRSMLAENKSIVSHLLSEFSEVRGIVSGPLAKEKVSGKEIIVSDGNGVLSAVNTSVPTTNMPYAFVAALSTSVVTNTSSSYTSSSASTGQEKMLPSPHVATPATGTPTAAPVFPANMSATNLDEPSAGADNQSDWNTVRKKKRSNKSKNKSSGSSTANSSQSDLNSNQLQGSGNNADSRANINASHPKNANARKLIKPLFIGSSSSNELRAVVRRKWLHISPFSTSATADQVKKYIARHTGMEENSIICSSLSKKGVDPSSLRHLNFKLGVNANSYAMLLRSELWPANIVVRSFKFKPKNDENQPMSDGNRLG